MPYDQQLAERVRKVLGKAPGFSEKKMFGGICFLLNGNMCAGVVGPDLMIRVDRAKYERFLVEPHARPMTFTGREMKGMLFVGQGGLATGPGLSKWLTRARNHVASLPEKTPKKARESASLKATSPRASTQSVRQNGTAKKSSAARVPAGKPVVTQSRSQSTNSNGFSGFPPQTFTFLRGLKKNNKKVWFDAHRQDYERFYRAPAEAFVAALGPELEKLRPIVYEPRINGSIFRVNRDVRFSKDKTPYKPHIDLWFWEGERKGWGHPGFYLRLGPTELLLGAGSHVFDKSVLDVYRRAVVDEKSGAQLERIVRNLEKAGYALPEPTRKGVPRGYPADHPRARYLLLDGLHMTLVAKVPPEATSAQLIKYCAVHCKKLAKVSAWISSHVS